MNTHKSSRSGRSNITRSMETTDAELARQIIWESNKKFVENHNANADKFGFTVAMNEFADLVSYSNIVISFHAMATL